ncbi:MAG: HEPN domain-containing protein [Oceanospirillales bacterium]|nr:MAG: HEPN domain-containing protein [Oceanospirillales bacterium]
MSDSETIANALIAKANTACFSAKTLLDIGDVDGATNRAYYAMFDAARAALILSDAPVGYDISRTHSGLIGAFGNYLVKNGPLSKEVGRLLNRAHEVRLVADYNDDSVHISDAKEIVNQAEYFISAIQNEFFEK